MGVVTAITREEFLAINPEVKTTDTDKFFSVRDNGQAILGVSGSVEFYNSTRELDQKEEFDLLAALSPRMTLDAENFGDSLTGNYDDEGEPIKEGKSSNKINIIESLIWILFGLVAVYAISV